MDSINLVNLISQNRSAKAVDLTYDILYSNSADLLADKRNELAQSIFNKD